MRDLYELLVTGEFRWAEPESLEALDRWEGTELLPADDPRLPAVQEAVIRWSKIDRPAPGMRSDRRALSRWAREIDQACRLPEVGKAG